jgi:hypothetical protein
MKTKKERLGPGFFYLFIGWQLCFWPGKVRNPIPCKRSNGSGLEKDGMGWLGRMVVVVFNYSRYVRSRY